MGAIIFNNESYYNSFRICFREVEMRLIVVDIECNQPSERIIQIGAVFVDLKNAKTIDSFDQYLDPEEPLDPFTPAAAPDPLIPSTPSIPSIPPPPPA